MKLFKKKLKMYITGRKGGTLSHKILPITRTKRRGDEIRSSANSTCKSSVGLSGDGVVTEMS